MKLIGKINAVTICNNTTPNVIESPVVTGGLAKPLPVPTSPAIFPAIASQPTAYQRRLYLNVL